MKSADTGRVRLRTLVLIRWVAVAGQTVALIAVRYGLGFPLPIVPALALVAASALLNIAVSLRWSASTRLSDRGTTCYLVYDILQLTGLLFLTGGLHNPFSLLFLAPMTISATILSLRSTLRLGLLAVTCASLLS
jgi:two-component system sensor histidine kinase RegB